MRVILRLLSLLLLCSLGSPWVVLSGTQQQQQQFRHLSSSLWLSTSILRSSSSNTNNQDDYDDDGSITNGNPTPPPSSVSSSSLRRLDGIERIYILSDLHTDNEENQKWLKTKMNQSDFNKEKDLIVVAGDISHDMKTFRKSMEVLIEKSTVVFVPGNHEAWIDRRRHHQSTTTTTTRTTTTSFEKLNQVLGVCQDMGVITTSVLVGGGGGQSNDDGDNNNGNANANASNNHCCGGCPVWIVPLESWYDGTLSFTNGKLSDLTGWPWADFRRCEWKDPDFPPRGPDDDGDLPTGLAKYFLQKNEPLLLQDPFAAATAAASSTNEKEEEEDDDDDNNNNNKSVGIMTVSHFLPNKQTLPDWKELDNPIFQEEFWLDHGAGGMSAKFAKVAGSALLDKQIRRLLLKPSAIKGMVVEEEENDDDNDEPCRKLPIRPRRHIHVFGHSHRPKDFDYEGIRYIHNPLGKPRERQLHMVSPDVDFQLVWDTRSGEVKGETLLRYWEEKGGGVKALKRRLEKVKPKGRYNRDKASAFNNDHNENNVANIKSSSNSNKNTSSTAAATTTSDGADAKTTTTSPASSRQTDVSSS